MMTAEKSADLILGNTPLPADDAKWYRHEVGKKKGAAAETEEQEETVSS
jgi:hypothetical protein